MTFFSSNNCNEHYPPGSRPSECPPLVNKSMNKYLQYVVTCDSY